MGAIRHQLPVSTPTTEAEREDVHMRAVIAEKHGGPEVLRLAERDAPVPGPGQLLVDVAAAGVNFADIYRRQGLPPYAGDVPYVAGLEGAGTVAAAGPGTDRVGDRVAWTDVPGSYAEQVIVPADRAVGVPEGVDLEVAAAVMLQGMTAHYLSSGTYPVARGEAVVVHAAAGGVGRATFDDSLAALRRRGYMVLYGAASGPVPPLELQRLATGGSLYVTRPTLVSYITTRDDLVHRADDLFSWIEQGTLAVRIGGRYPLDQAARAHEDLAARRTTGKLILLPR